MIYDIRANEIIPEQIRNFENGSGAIQTYSGGMDSTSYLDDTYYTAGMAIGKNNFVAINSVGKLEKADWCNPELSAIGFILDSCRENDTVKVYNKCVVAPVVSINGILENPHLKFIEEGKQYFLWSNQTLGEESTGGMSPIFHWESGFIHQEIAIGLGNNRMYVDCRTPELMV